MTLDALKRIYQCTSQRPIAIVPAWFMTATCYWNTIKYLKCLSPSPEFAQMQPPSLWSLLCFPNSEAFIFSFFYYFQSMLIFFLIHQILQIILYFSNMIPLDKIQLKLAMVVHTSDLNTQIVQASRSDKGFNFILGFLARLRQLGCMRCCLRKKNQIPETFRPWSPSLMWCWIWF